MKTKWTTHKYTQKERFLIGFDQLDMLNSQRGGNHTFFENHTFLRHIRNDTYFLRWEETVDRVS